MSSTVLVRKYLKKIRKIADDSQLDKKLMEEIDEIEREILEKEADRVSETLLEIGEYRGYTFRLNKSKHYSDSNKYTYPYVLAYKPGSGQITIGRFVSIKGLKEKVDKKIAKDKEKEVKK